jgi:hypothetical protein
VRAAGERLDVQRLRVLPVDPVADAAQPREVAQALRRGGSAGHLRDRATSQGPARDPESTRAHRSHLTQELLHTVLRRRARGESIADIRKDLIIPTGKRKGQNPSPASIYRALAEHTRREVYPDVVAQAEAASAELQART